MKWTVALARQRLSELLRAAAEQPQLIYRRNQPVAVVVDVGTFREYDQWREDRCSRSVADAFAELRAVCEQEGYELKLPERADRPNSFAEEAVNGAHG